MSAAESSAMLRGRCWLDAELDAALDAAEQAATAAEALTYAEAHCEKVASDPERLGLAVPELAQACARLADRANTVALGGEIAADPTLVSGHAMAVLAAMCRGWAADGTGTTSDERREALDAATQLSRVAAEKHNHIGGWATHLGALTDAQGHSVEVNAWAQKAHEGFGFATPLVREYVRALEVRRGGDLTKHLEYCRTVAQAQPYGYAATVLAEAVLGYGTGELDGAMQQFSLFKLAKTATRFAKHHMHNQELLHLCSDAALARVQSVGPELLSHRTHQMWAHYFCGSVAKDQARLQAHAAHVGDRFHPSYDDLGPSYKQVCGWREQAGA